MSTNKERHEALLRVVSFAREQGFPSADAAYWDPNDVETGNVDVGELLECHEPGIYPVSVGIYLNKDIRFQKHGLSDDSLIDDYEAVGLAEGEAP